jgi:hypothetical protein
MKQGSLFCFVLFCFALVVRLICSKSRCFMPHSWYLQKALCEYGCTDLVWDCLELHMWKLLIIESFVLSMKTNYNRNWNLHCNLRVFLWLLESPRWVRFSRVYFTVFRAKVWKIFEFWVNFVAGNSKQLLKIGCGTKKNQLSSQCVHIVKYKSFPILKILRK